LVITAHTHTPAPHTHHTHCLYPHTHTHVRSCATTGWFTRAMGLPHTTSISLPDTARRCCLRYCASPRAYARTALPTHTTCCSYHYYLPFRCTGLPSPPLHACFSTGFSRTFRYYTALYLWFSPSFACALVTATFSLFFTTGSPHCTTLRICAALHYTHYYHLGLRHTFLLCLRFVPSGSAGSTTCALPRLRHSIRGSALHCADATALPRYNLRAHCAALPLLLRTAHLRHLRCCCVSHFCFFRATCRDMPSSFYRYYLSAVCLFSRVDALPAHHCTSADLVLTLHGLPCCTQFAAWTLFALLGLLRTAAPLTADTDRTFYLRTARACLCAAAFRSFRATCLFTATTTAARLLHLHAPAVCHCVVAFSLPLYTEPHRTPDWITRTVHCLCHACDCAPFLVVGFLQDLPAACTFSCTCARLLRVGFCLTCAFACWFLKVLVGYPFCRLPFYHVTLLPIMLLLTFLVVATTMPQPVTYILLPYYLFIYLHGHFCPINVPPTLPDC